MPDYRRRAVREAMSVRLDVNGMMAEGVGAAGVTREAVDALGPRLSEVTHALKGRRTAGELPSYDLPRRKEQLAPIKALAAEVRAECDALVVLGSGGSALGVRTLIAAAEPTARVIVSDSIDPMHFGQLLDRLDLARTGFNVVSKSAETADTMAQFLIVRDLLLRQLGAVDYVKHLIVTTDADAGALRQVVHDEGFRALDIPAGVGGRFSALSPVGLFPAAFAGLRIDDVLAGAEWMDTRCQEADVWRNPGHLLGTLLYLADTRHAQNIVAVLPYSDRLNAFAAWFAQLWAESVGKAETLEGTSAHVGQTPVVAPGPYGLLQLLTQGPADKVAIMVRVEDHGRELPVPAAYADLDNIGYLGGVGLGQLVNVEQRATEIQLLRQQRPALTIILPQLTAFTLGQLVYLIEDAAVFAAALYRIDPFSQPGVDEWKRITSAQIGRKGCESVRAEVEALLARKRAELIV